jgi:hypothetical protein
VESTQDFGLGGAALAVRVEGPAGNETVRIWLGTLYEHTARPAQYTVVGGTLADTEVAAPAVHMFTWRPGQGFSAPQSTPLHPTSSDPRGAYGVVGMCLADVLLGDPYTGDELIVGTLSGDLIVYAASTMVEHWRTHMPGDIGHYNSILAEDLDNDGKKELYVAGSYGLRRFVLPGE